MEQAEVPRVLILTEEQLAAHGFWSERAVFFRVWPLAGPRNRCMALHPCAYGQLKLDSGDYLKIKRREVMKPADDALGEGQELAGGSAG